MRRFYLIKNASLLLLCGGLHAAPIDLKEFSALEVHGASESLFITLFQANPAVGLHGAEFEGVLKHWFSIGESRMKVEETLKKLLDNYKWKDAVEVSYKDEEIAVKVALDYSDFRDVIGVNLVFSDEGLLQSFDLFSGSLLLDSSTSYNPDVEIIPTDAGSANGVGD